MICFTDTFSTSFGLFSLAIDAEGRLLATAFGSTDVLRRRMAPGHMSSHEPTRLIHDQAATRELRTQVLAYDAGELTAFNIPMAPGGTPFQQRVWQALREIPFGYTRTYGQLARELGQPSAARAVGRANATNPICLIVPCHRVIGTNGTLTGFAFGEDIKHRLIEHEKRVACLGVRSRTLAAIA